jgi:hypothetical protein
MATAKYTPVAGILTRSEETQQLLQQIVMLMTGLLVLLMVRL